MQFKLVIKPQNTPIYNSYKYLYYSRIINQLISRSRILTIQVLVAMQGLQEVIALIAGSTFTNNKLLITNSIMIVFQDLVIMMIMDTQVIRIVIEVKN